MSEQKYKNLIDALILGIGIRDNGPLTLDSGS